MTIKAAKPLLRNASDREVFYRSVLEALTEAGIEYMIGGGHALELYSGISRKTKDLDLFLRPRDVKIALETLAEKHYETTFCYPHWLGKIFYRSDFIDLIFSSGNGICQVDNGWFENSVAGEMFDVAVIFCPPEEMIWAKAFVMERERYDGADIAHLIRACGTRLNWQRLLERFGLHWRVLLSHVVLFEYIYPSESSRIPAWLRGELMDRLRDERSAPLSRNHVCRGPLLSRTQYRDDVETWGYEDARQLPCGPMTSEEAAQWTAAGENNG